jgi:hypothetical protein
VVNASVASAALIGLRTRASTFSLRISAVSSSAVSRTVQPFGPDDFTFPTPMPRTTTTSPTFSSTDTFASEELFSKRAVVVDAAVR